MKRPPDVSIIDVLVSSMPVLTRLESLITSDESSIVHGAEVDQDRILVERIDGPLKPGCSCISRVVLRRKRCHLFDLLSSHANELLLGEVHVFFSSI